MQYNGAIIFMISRKGGKIMEKESIIEKKRLKKTAIKEQEVLLSLYRGEFDDECDNSPYSTQCTC